MTSLTLRYVDALLAAAAVLATPAGYLELCKRHDLPLHWGHPRVLGVFSHASHPNSKLTYKVGLQRDGAADTESSSETFTTNAIRAPTRYSYSATHMSGHRALRDTKSVCAFS